MLGMVARGYFTELKSYWRREKRWTGIFWVFYCLTILPLMLGYFDSLTRTGVYMAVAIPFVWFVAQSGACPLRLPGMLFLCPLDETMRRSYVRRSCRFRVGLHTAVGAVGALATRLAGNDWMGTLGLTLNIFLLSVLGIHTNRGEKKEIRWTVVRCVGVALGTMLQIVYADVAASGGLQKQARWEQILIAVMQMLLALFAAIYVTWWRAMQEEVILYERDQSPDNRGGATGYA